MSISRGVHHWYELLLITTFIAIVIKVALAQMETAVGSHGVIECTEKGLRSYLGMKYNWAFEFSWHEYGCVFTFQCPTDCLCILSDRNMTVDCPSGQSLHPVVYPSTSMNLSFQDNLVYSNADSYSSIEVNADSEYNDYSYSSYYVTSSFHDFGHTSSNTAVWYNAGLTNITRDAFASLNRHVEYIMLSHNKIRQLHQRQFSGLVNLAELYLNHNRIVVIQPGSFDGLEYLSSLYLDHNSIVKIHPESFDGLVNLVDLQLCHNRIVEIYTQSFDGLVNLLFLTLDHNNIIEIHPGSFDVLVNLVNLQLGHNSIVVIKIYLGLFDRLVKLKYLFLNNNDIIEIYPGLFRGLVNLEYLWLDHNSVVEVHPGLFDTVVNIRCLYLEHNSIVEIHMQSFIGLVNLEVLRLSHNSIVKIHPGLFDGLVNLKILQLDHNNIVKIHPGLFDGLFSLLYLQLSYNSIVTLDWQVFNDLDYLHILFLRNNRIAALHTPLNVTLSFTLAYLDLSHNNLETLTLPSTLKFSNLENGSLLYDKLVDWYGVNPPIKTLYLDLSENSFDRFDSTSYFNNSIGRVKILDLRKNDLYSVNNNSFIGFDRNTSVLVDNEATCCFIKTANCNATIPRSQFLTCGRLLPNLFQRTIMWILGLFSLAANIGTLSYRCRNRQENTVQVFLISNLSISDMLMGIYMIIVASADLYYKEFFPSESWRLSFTCKFAGTLSILSSEASVLFVTLISLDRFMGIRYTFSIYRLGSKSSKVLSMLLWVIAIVLSVTSTVISIIDPNWYDVSEVCTGLPLSRRNVFESEFKQQTFNILDPSTLNNVTINSTYDVIVNHAPGMYYGIAVFTVLNAICFLIVFICYTGIFITTIQTAKQAGRARNLKEERKMATKMGVIVMTDLACWAPVIILSILVQSGRHIVTPEVYTWIVTFVLPINSAINPFLYTLATLIFDYIHDRHNRLHPVHT